MNLFDRSQAYVMRCGLKFLCAANKVDMVRYGCVNFEDLLSALGCLEEQVSLSVDACVEANDDPHFCVEKINGR